MKEYARFRAKTSIHSAKYMKKLRQNSFQKSTKLILDIYAVYSCCGNGIFHFLNKIGTFKPKKSLQISLSFFIIIHVNITQLT